MRLPFFRAKPGAAEPAPTPRRRAATAASAATAPDDAGIAAARTQARRRLVGALVLLIVGVVGFPLLFETQPRALPQDTPIVVGDAVVARPAATASTPAAPRVLPLPVLPVDAGVEPVAAATAASAPAAAASAPAQAVAPRPAASAPRPAPAAATATPAAGRWVVQVGAYNDNERLKAARAKLQKLGYTSYTQEVDSSSGRRTRVRVGPFKTRAEADAVAAKVKTAGLQAAVLSL